MDKQSSSKVSELHSMNFFSFAEEELKKKIRDSVKEAERIAKESETETKSLKPLSLEERILLKG